MTKLFTVLIAFLITIGSQVSAFDPADLQKLKDTGDCLECDLSGANLRGAYLSGANLKSANLGGANLVRANLEDATLWDANLESADLAGANLQSANLGGANLNSTNLNGADLWNAYLRFVRMKGAILCNTTMPDGSVTYSGC
jgi:uncharacterized protein YjbI with pentapeptide repeats